MNKRQAQKVAKWLEALRSGDYSQATQWLFGHEDDNVGYCCLGVLCRISAGNWTAKEFWSSFTPRGNKVARWDTFPDPEWFHTQTGLLCDEEKFYDNGDWYTDGGDVKFLGNLASLNDEGSSFKEIANVIEERAFLVDPNWKDKL